MSSSEEKTPTISPDQGATGETTTLSENKEAGTQTGLSKEEKKAHLDEVEENAILGMMNSVKAGSRSISGYNNRNTLQTVCKGE